MSQLLDALAILITGCLIVYGLARAVDGIARRAPLTDREVSAVLDERAPRRLPVEPAEPTLERERDARLASFEAAKEVALQHAIERATPSEKLRERVGLYDTAIVLDRNGWPREGATVETCFFLTPNGERDPRAPHGALKTTSDTNMLLSSRLPAGYSVRLDAIVLCSSSVAAPADVEAIASRSELAIFTGNGELVKRWGSWSLKAGSPGWNGTRLLHAKIEPPIEIAEHERFWVTLTTPPLIERSRATVTLYGEMTRPRAC